MSAAARRLLVAVAVSVFCACGSSSGGGSSGSTSGGGSSGGGSSGGSSGGSNGGGQAVNEVTFPLNSGSVSFSGNALANYQHDSNANTLVILLADATGSCTNSGPSFHSTEGKYQLQLHIRSYGTDIAPLAAGTTYSQDTTDIPSAEADQFHAPANNSCSPQQIAYNADGAPTSITITALDATHIAGSYAFRMEGTHAGDGYWDVSGTFDAPLCDGNVNTACN